MTEWKLYYADLTTFSSDDGPWIDAPPWGVMGVASPDPFVGREVDTNRPGTGDYYVWDPDGLKPWWVDSGGLEDYLIRKGIMGPHRSLEQVTPATKITAGVKFGRSVNNQAWRDIYAWMVADADATFSGLEGERVPPPHI